MQALFLKLPYKFTVFYNALYVTWFSGLGYFDRFKSSVSNDKDEMEKSFRFFKTLLDKEIIESSTYAEFKMKVNDGLHSKIPLVKVGSFIAEKLSEKHGNSKLDYYRKNNVIVFFKDLFLLFQNKFYFISLFASIIQFDTIVIGIPVFSARC